ncbi:MAG: ATP-binding protein [Desulforudis sp.]|nr:MAG: ATP-binding protein [Desulforudis sp.]
MDLLPVNDYSEIGRVVAVASGKGGVGKSSVTALLAVALARRGRRVGVLDADLTGPSIPKIFGLSGRPGVIGQALAPVESASLGIRVMSINLMLEQEDEPVIWRGPIIGGVIKQFWNDVAWGKLDYLLIDLPPGTGDAPLTVMQSIPVDAVVMVSSPQALAGMIVRKAIKMTNIMNVPIAGLVENMSYATCPKCNEHYELFGPSRAEEISAETGLAVLGKLPLDSAVAALADRGQIEQYEADHLPNLAIRFEDRMNELPKRPSITA